ncbi:dihydrofolate reductase [Alteribacter natronophilus]|uniref:dihydrofolate reductase n=1 Tax=Alteribacter natronophilus TaxID=2583810 RepID=UPI00110E4CAB|nr:dihydrofolate reductase [Alteribacter natronophilus]TMW72473.1 dihydrofolate reductase [Alteribacter natronophilus]
MISMIAAMDENNVIGRNNDLPWNLPNDLAWFKRVTSGHTVVMGRKTFESIGKALPNRKNIVVTSNEDFEAEDVEVWHDLDKVKQFSQTEEEVMVLGGQKIFEQLIDFADRLYVTRIHHTFEGDTYFPPISAQIWEVAQTYDGKTDADNEYAHTFYVYERKK